jgi:hypothetical protein
VADAAHAGKPGKDSERARQPSCGFPLLINAQIGITILPIWADAYEITHPETNSISDSINRSLYSIETGYYSGFLG